MTKLRIQLDNMPTGYLTVFFSFHKYDKKLAFNLYGLYNGSPSARLGKRSYCIAIRGQEPL